MTRLHHDLQDVESDLRHLSTLIDVITDMAVEFQLSKGAAQADHAGMSVLRDMLWIARDLASRVQTDMSEAVGREVLT